MYPYFIFLLIVVILASATQKHKQTPTISRFFGFGVFLILVLFAGLRNSSVGTDTGNYVRNFLSDRNDDFSVLEIKSSLEIGYLFIERFAKTVTSQYWFLLSLIALITVYFYYKTIIKLSKNYTISFFVFITLGSYLFFFNGARQGIAAAIFSFSIIHIIKGNFKKYVMWIGIAFLFHKTVLITLPLYFIFRLRFSIKNLIITAFSSLILILYSWSILSLLPESFSFRYAQYQDRGSKGGLLLTVFYVLITFIFIGLHKFISKENRKYYDVYLNMTIFNTIIYIVVYFAGLDINLVRLSLYFSLGFILIWPIIFEETANKTLPFLFVLFAFGHLVFYYIYLGKMANLTPYIFNKTFFITY